MKSEGERKLGGIGLLHPPPLRNMLTPLSMASDKVREGLQRGSSENVREDEGDLHNEVPTIIPSAALCDQ